MNTPLTRYEYLKLNIKELPDDVIEQYNLVNKATMYSYIYVKIQKGMYNLPQAGLLAQQALGKNSTIMGITSQRKPLACGSTNGDSSHSRLSLTILE